LWPSCPCLEALYQYIVAPYLPALPRARDQLDIVNVTGSDPCWFRKF